MVGTRHGLSAPLPAGPLTLIAALALSAGPAFAFTAPFQTGSIHSTDEPGDKLLRVFSTYQQRAGGKNFEFPRLEGFYRLTEKIELEASVPFEFSWPARGGTYYALGSASVTLGYKIYEGNDDSWIPKIGITPELFFPAPLPQWGIGRRHVHAHLPLVIEKEFGDKWSLVSNLLYAFNPGRDNRNYWFLGTAVAREITDKISVGGELFYRSSTSVDIKDTIGFNLGVRYSIAEKQTLYFSAGRALLNPVNTNQVSAQLVYELAF